jgi:hypothetical protein
MKNFCLYCGDDPRFEVYPNPTFGTLSFSMSLLNFDPDNASIYFAETGEKPTILSWPRTAIFEMKLVDRKIDFDQLCNEHSCSVAEELSDKAGIRSFNVPLPTVRITVKDANEVIHEGIRLEFAFGTAYRTRLFGTELARAYHLQFD